MADPTEYHELNTYEKGDTDWDHTDTVERVDEELPKTGTLAERPANAPEGRYYTAEDVRIIFRYDPTNELADGDGWVAVSGAGSEDEPLPGTVHRESVHTEETRTTEPIQQLMAPYQRETEATLNGTQLLPLNDPTDWTVFNGSAEQVDDAYLGETAIKLDNLAGDSRSRIRYSFSAARDFSNNDLTMAVKLLQSGWSVNNIRIELQDANNSLFYRSRIHSDATNEWVRLNFAFDDGASDSSLIDLANIESIDLRLESGSHEYIVSDLRTVIRPNKGYIIFTFDDIHETDYTVAFEVLGKYGFSGHSFVPTDYIGETGRLSVDQMSDMKSRGWTFGAHGHLHENFSEMTRKEQVEEMETSNKILKENGFMDRANTFRTPFSDYNQDTLELMGEWYDISFTGQTGVTGGGARLGGTRLVGAQGGDNYEGAKDVVSRTAEFQHLTALTIHEITDRAGFEDLVSDVKNEVENGNVEVITPLDILRPQVPAGL